MRYDVVIDLWTLLNNVHIDWNHLFNQNNKILQTYNNSFLTFAINFRKKRFLLSKKCLLRCEIQIKKIFQTVRNNEMKIKALSCKLCYCWKAIWLNEMCHLLKWLESILFWLMLLNICKQHDRTMVLETFCYIVWMVLLRKICVSH